MAEGSRRGGLHSRHVRLCTCHATTADERKHWLREAAYEGHIPAIYSYALECSAPINGDAG